MKVKFKGEEMISKELLSEVLGVHNINLILEDANEINYTQYASMSRGMVDNYINIYELADTCKKWAFKKGYVVGTDLDKVNVWSIKERIVINHFEVYFEDYLEFEIKACQWILENKN